MSTEESAFFTDFGKTRFLHCFFDLGGRDVFGILSVLILVFFRDKSVATSRFEIRLHKPFRVLYGACVFKIFCDFSSDVSLSDRKYNAFNFSPVSEIVRILIKV